MSELYPDDEPVAAALNYAVLAMMQRARPDVLLPLGGQPPEVGPVGWPPDWKWEPVGTPGGNLRKARHLLDVALAEGKMVLNDGYPYQSDVAAWVAQFNNTVEIQALQLGEEVGEVYRAIVKRHQRIRGTEEDWTQQLKAELGDAFLSLLALTDLEGFDLATIATLRWMEKMNYRPPQLPEMDNADDS